MLKHFYKKNLSNYNFKSIQYSIFDNIALDIRIRYSHGLVVSKSDIRLVFLFRIIFVSDIRHLKFENLEP